MFITIHAGYSDFDFHDCLKERKGLIIFTIKTYVCKNFVFVFVLFWEVVVSKYCVPGH